MQDAIAAFEARLARSERKANRVRLAKMQRKAQRTPSYASKKKPTKGKRHERQSLQDDPPQG